jgi:hypothetical protein
MSLQKFRKPRLADKQVTAEVKPKVEKKIKKSKKK